MAVVNPVGYQHNRSDHTAQIDRLSSAGGLLLPATVGELRARGCIRTANDMFVSAQATPNMSVSVAAGIGYVPGPTAVSGTYTFVNDGAVTVPIGAAHATLPRRDLVVARVRDSFYSGAVNLGDIFVVPGTAASSPADPALPAGASYLVLARVTVRAGTTSIISTDISNIAPPVQVGALNRWTYASGIPGSHQLPTTAANFPGTAQSVHVPRGRTLEAHFSIPQLNAGFESHNQFRLIINEVTVASAFLGIGFGYNMPINVMGDWFNEGADANIPIRVTCATVAGTAATAFANPSPTFFRYRVV